MDVLIIYLSNTFVHGFVFKTYANLSSFYVFIIVPYKILSYIIPNSIVVIQLWSNSKWYSFHHINHHYHQVTCLDKQYTPKMDPKGHYNRPQRPLFKNVLSYRLSGLYLLEFSQVINHLNIIHILSMILQDENTNTGMFF